MGADDETKPLKESSPVASTEHKHVNKISVFSTDLLRIYYSRLFPFKQMFKWLCYGHDPDMKSENPAIEGDFFGKREFSFTIANDVYIRHQSFPNAKELEAKIHKLQPHKIDIGAFYPVPPKLHNTVNPKSYFPVQRELVFDIDLTDYDEVRLGCEPSQLWAKGSWQYMAVAIKVLHSALTEDFGFKHLFWVFSGRRGVHCWVCDESARLLDDPQRVAIVNYLTLISGNENQKDRVGITNPLHPAIERSMPLLRQVFEDMVLDDENGQALMATTEKYERILSMIPDEAMRERLRVVWKDEPELSSKKKWAQLRDTIHDEVTKLKSFKSKQLLKSLDSIVILHTYPRLDANVSKDMKHLLKSPFVVHPKTGNVCIPITDVENCDKFNPDAVPNLSSLVDEINDAGMPTDGMEIEKTDLEKTSLNAIVKAFEKEFLDPLYLDIKSKFRAKRQSLAASNGDW